MAKRSKPQHDIGRTLNRLLPLQGTPKTLGQIRDQLRLLNEITDPSDDRLTRIVLGYFQEAGTGQQGARFLKVDRHLSPDDLSARWTRVRIGPRVRDPAPTARGNPPDRRLISARMPSVLASSSRSGATTFYLWDLLKKHFGVTSDNNRYYREWLSSLAQTLSSHPEFVVIGIDDETDLPVEWMLATDRQGQIHSTVASRVPELIGWMNHAEGLVHRTRDLVHRFFSPEVVDDTYDIHAYFKAVSKILADAPAVRRVWLRDDPRQIEAWYLTDRFQRIIEDRLDPTRDWLRSTGRSHGTEAITRQLLQAHPELASAEAVQEQVSDALSADLRFVFDKSCSEWRAVPPGPHENLPVYHVLWDQWSAMSLEALVEKIRDSFTTPRTRFSLDNDERFSTYPGGRWGLRQWVDIGDWALKYLGKKQTALPTSTIKRLACEELDLAPHLVVFIPDADPRFVQRPNGRWGCRHFITDSELVQMLVLLETRKSGLTLNGLVAQALGLDAQETDALARMMADDRFIPLEGRWFVWDKIAYSLADLDLDQLHTRLHQAGTGLRLTTLVRRVLNRDAHLTDAEEKLRADSRFREIASGVWVPADYEPPTEDRTPVFNRPIRSEAIPVVPEDEYTEVEELTEREAQPGGETAPAHRVRITRTLSLLDVRHGNLVLGRQMANLLSSDCAEAVQFIDELGDEFTVWVDRDNDLLQGLGGWFEARQLTFGDRVTIRKRDQDGLLQIEPTGQRDKRVYEEALQRQDIENLREDALESGKSFHDLMIEVMESINRAAGKPVPLHREDIYKLVDHRRIASRDYIFSLLSLTDCPYEELRYFVSHGRGYWSYDPERRRAFEMKMNQLVEQVENLRAENESLRQELASVRNTQSETGATMQQLTEQAINHAAELADLSAENAELSRINEAFAREKATLTRQAQELGAQVSDLERQVALQTTELDTVRSESEALREQLLAAIQEGTELRDAQTGQQREFEELKKALASKEQELVALQAKAEQAESRGAAARAEVEQLQMQVDSLLADNAALGQQCDQAKATVEAFAEESRVSQKALRQELESERRQVQQLRDRLRESEGSSAMMREESAQLSARMGLVHSALRTPPGKAFVVLQKILGGPDLSEL